MRKSVVESGRTTGSHVAIHGQYGVPGRAHGSTHSGRGLPS